MIKSESFYNKLKYYGTEFFTGVPDSLLKSFCAYITDNAGKNNVIAANEGNAVGLAAGYYLATGKIPLVYMQNSGIGNAINPIVSLADKMVYEIPMLILIGYRGEPGKKDEPQHKKQGIITTELIKTLDIKYEVIDENTNEADLDEKLHKAYEYMENEKVPFVLIVKKGTFEEYILKNEESTEYEMTREKAVETIIDEIEEDSIIVSTTGMTSRELFEIRERKNQGHMKDFLTVGSMGHASSIAMGIAMNKTDRNVYCLDGDGAAIMHMGAMAVIGSRKLKNYTHIVINNGAHDSVGGQKTVGFNIVLTSIAEGCGYEKIFMCTTEEELRKILRKIRNSNKLSFIEVRVKKGARKDLGRPTIPPVKNKENFMCYLNE